MTETTDGDNETNVAPSTVIAQITRRAPDVATTSHLIGDKSSTTGWGKPRYMAIVQTDHADTNFGGVLEQIWKSSKVI